jgi:hypothetical protein
MPFDNPRKNVLKMTRPDLTRRHRAFKALTKLGRVPFGSSNRPRQLSMAVAMYKVDYAALIFKSLAPKPETTTLHLRRKLTREAPAFNGTHTFVRYRLMNDRVNSLFLTFPIFSFELDQLDSMR